MNSLESVRKILEDHLQEASTYNEIMQMALILSNENFSRRVYDAFFNLIADSTQTPEDIVLKLDTYTSGLDGFSTNIPIQSLIAHACLESLAIRKPKSLCITGPWEKLVWIVVKYSSYITNNQGSVLLPFKKTTTDTLYWITKIISQKSCPNPCLRLELFRLMRNFKCDHGPIDQKSLRDKFIFTLLELSDNYTSITVNQLPNFCPEDLQLVMQDNNVSMGYLMNDYDLHTKKNEIIAAVLKLSRIFALLEKERQTLDPSSLLMPQLSACLYFCGLIPLIPEDDLDDDECMLYFIQDVSNDPLLMNYLIDTLDTITQVSMCFPEEVGLEEDVKYANGRMLHRFFKSYIRNLPKHQYLQEIHGGNAPAKEYYLRYIQNNMVDKDNDSDSDFDYEDNVYRSSDAEDISDE